MVAVVVGVTRSWERELVVVPWVTVRVVSRRCRRKLEAAAGQLEARLFFCVRVHRFVRSSLGSLSVISKATEKSQCVVKRGYQCFSRKMGRSEGRSRCSRKWHEGDLIRPLGWSRGIRCRLWISGHFTLIGTLEGGRSADSDRALEEQRRGGRELLLMACPRAPGTAETEAVGEAGRV
jgi:hypothetical protein